MAMLYRGSLSHVSSRDGTRGVALVVHSINLS